MKSETDLTRIRPARVDDADTILGDIRWEDVQEWRAATPMGIDHLAKSIEGSSECWTLADKATDRPLVIWGVVSAGPTHETIWMVATYEGANKAAVTWYEVGDWIDAFWVRHPYVDCWADARNEVHHRWLKWLGFEEGETRPWGYEGREFTYFWRG